MEKVPNEDDGILMPILVSLLIFVGIVTFGLFAYIGYNVMTGQAVITSDGNTSQTRVKQSQPNVPIQTKEDQKGSTQTPSGGAEPKRPSQVAVQPEQTKPTTPQTPAQSGNQDEGNIYTHDFSGGRVLITTASDNSGDPVYHTKDCQAAKKISPESEKWFDSAQDAENAGRRLCGYCNR